jgi:hypothetical protein
MGGFGSGQKGGRATVEGALQLDIDVLARRRVIQQGVHVGGEMTFRLDDDELRIQFEALARDPADSWLRLQYHIRDSWTGEQHEIDDKIRLAASRPRFGGQRWWFLCPNENRRVRKLYLPLGRRRFRSRHFYRLSYTSQLEAPTTGPCGAPASSASGSGEIWRTAAIPKSRRGCGGDL